MKQFIIILYFFEIFACGSSSVRQSNRSSNYINQENSSSKSINEQQSDDALSQEKENNEKESLEDKYLDPDFKSGPTDKDEKAFVEEKDEIDLNQNSFQLADPIKHKTDFLASGCLTHLYPALSDDDRLACRAGLLKNGYTHIYIYIYNERDYETIYPKGALGFNFYDNPNGFVVILKELLAAGLTPIVWLIPDDARTMRSTPVNTIKQYFSNVISVIDPYVGSYVLGLELDEYWTETQVEPLGEHLNSLTQKKIGIHLTSRDSPTLRFMENSWADYLLYQYGFGKSAAEISSVTRQMVNKLNAEYNGKPLVAGEYNINRGNNGILEYTVESEQEGIKLGDAARSAGAVGFGNGGTP